MSIDMAQFHQVFFEESFEGLEIMETGLLGMEPGAVDDEEINAIFRGAHSIKGGAGTFGFMEISGFTHIMETILDEMRDGKREATQPVTDSLLRSVDILRDMLDEAAGDGEADQDKVKHQQAELEAILSGDASGGAAESAAVEEKVEEVAVKFDGWHVVFRPHLSMMRLGNDPVRILRELDGLGEMTVEADISSIPNLDEYEPEDCYISWDVHILGDVSEDDVREVFDWVDDECDLAFIPILPEGAEAEMQAQAAQSESPAVEPVKQEMVPVERRGDIDKKDRRAKDRRGKKKAAAAGGGSIRVDTSKIDTLINMVGELVITQSMLNLLGDDFSMDKLDRLQEGLVQLERHTREMQESVMQIRMLPISFTFSRFPRLVHDLSTKLGKKIELQMIGETTEVDKTVIEKIGDPLVHLVRNSLDHGLEGPEERLAAGKGETGTIKLIAYHKGGSIVIEIRDDGRGLNTDKIEEKAIEKGVIPADHNLSEQELNELIFAAGFSTADTVSDVSGRGVGMDVVRRNITELGGSIEIESVRGQGSGIIIRLPLTLAILDGQSIAVGSETYIIPLISIVESILIEPGMVNLVAGKGETFKLRDEYLPIIRLHEVLGVQDAKATNLEDGLLVVVEGDGGHHYGLFVDDLLGQQQVVIKSLEANYEKVEGFSGATILGDGGVALIFDIASLIALAGTTNSPDLKLSA